MRDLDGFFWGNHTYIVFVPDDPTAFAGNPNMIDLYGGNQGCTIAGFNGADEKPPTSAMVGKCNQKADVASCREFHDPKRYNKLTGHKDSLSGREPNPDKYKTGWDTECHEVKPPAGMSDTDFIKLLMSLFENYNSAPNRPDYDKFDCNCTTLANSLLEKGGCTLNKGITDFSGNDYPGDKKKIPPDVWNPHIKQP